MTLGLGTIAAHRLSYHRPSANAGKGVFAMRKSMNRIRLNAAVLITLLLVTQLAAQQPAQRAASERLTLDSLFTYAPKFLGPLQWQADGSGYLMLDPSASHKGYADIVRYNAATGEK